MPETTEKELQANLARMADEMAEIKSKLPPLLWVLFSERCGALSHDVTEGAIEALREWIDRHPAPLTDVGTVTDMRGV